MSRKLQIKRGNEADMPTLASGEMGFALDSKRLFVGAGNENVPINSGRMQEEAAEVAEIIANVAAVTNKAAEHEIRIKRLEDGMFSNLNKNPFLVGFDSLNGVQVTKGVWNKVNQRLEC